MDIRGVCVRERMQLFNRLIYGVFMPFFVWEMNFGAQLIQVISKIAKFIAVCLDLSSFTWNCINCKFKLLLQTIRDVTLEGTLLSSSEFLQLYFLLSRYKSNNKYS